MATDTIKCQWCGKTTTQEWNPLTTPKPRHCDFGCAWCDETPHSLREAVRHALGKKRAYDAVPPEVS